MRESFVEHLRCPETGAPLRVEINTREDDHIIEGELISQDDPRHRYPIRGGIPRIVAVSALENEQRETIESFEYKWERIPDYAAEAKTKKNREAWYFERFGFSRGDADIREFLSDAQFILEAGTGTGVDTDLLTRNSNARVFGIDISRAIEIAFARFHDNPRVALLQADIARLPFASEFFDVISCDQVLHHTPNPPENFNRLARLLKPGGRLLLYVYRVKGPLREFADDHLRGIMTHASAEECLNFSERITRLGRNLSRLKVTVDVEDDLPELGIEKGTYDVQRLIYDHVLKCFWNDDYDFETNAMINFDWYHPLHAFRYTEKDLQTWAQASGLEIMRLHTAPSGISAIFRK